MSVSLPIRQWGAAVHAGVRTLDLLAFRYGKQNAAKELSSET
jgi:hypothetical protein